MAATNTRKAILIRTGVVFAGMVVFAFTIVWFLFNIKFVERKKWVSLADSLSTRVFELKAERGNIFDCNGNLLATSLPIYDVRIDGKSVSFKNDELFYKEVDSLAFYLNQLFKDKSTLSYKNILINVKKTGNMYYLLKRNVSYSQMRALLTYPIFREGRYKGGIHVYDKNRRIKPFDLLAERTIGFKQANVAKVGIEGSFDEYLSGKSGKSVMQRIAGGTWIPIDNSTAIDAEKGKDIVTTLDINLQDVATSALMNTLVENDAESGTTILMEVATGEIKAIANLTRKKEGEYQEAYNYAIGSSIEPGSTFKLASMMVMLDEGVVKPNDLVDAEGGSKVFCSSPMYDSHLGTETITMQQAFEHSSNVAIAKQMVKFFGKNPTEVYNFYKSLGLTQSLNINISGEGRPNLKSPSDKSWSCTSLPWMSIGYEILITPMHIITLYNAVANNGTMVKPLLIKRILNAGQTIKEYQTEVLNPSICKSTTVKYLKDMMEGVVQRGTAKRLKSDFYHYAGKTGTALVANNNTGYKSNGEKSYRASFCGYFPAENPKFTCYVLISKPSKGKIYGAELALPVFKEIADKVYANSLNLHKDFKYVNHFETEDLPTIQKGFAQDLKHIYNSINISHHFHNDSITEEESIWASSWVQNKAIAIEPMLHKGGELPDVIGMGPKDAIYLLESKGFKVSVLGVGKVLHQSEKAGSTVKPGSLVQLKLG